ncbi:MAG: A/G-specific adenine glycosylase [Azospirillaceae bacterium]
MSIRPTRDTVVPALLAWYDRHRRALPWRAAPGARPDAYRVWLSEIMLQQTTVATVGPYFRAFITRWPSVRDLAAADREDVLRAWAGLGYYARARNLHACARAVAETCGGVFPDTEQALLALPGIGAYTAAAIAAIAFDRPATVVDGNVERVVARLFALSDPLPDVKPAIRAAAATLTPATRPGDFAQAMMDLGATICTPRQPKCLACPVAGACHARMAGSAADLPRRRAKTAKPVRRAVIFVIGDGSGAVLVRSRPDEGLLGGMTEFPSTPWAAADPPPLASAARHAPVAAAWRETPGVVRHVFTHFALELTVVLGRSHEVAAPPGHRWIPLDQLGSEALPTVMAKVARHAQKHGE